MTKDEWVQWKNNSTTIEFRKAVEEQIEIAKDELAGGAGKDSYDYGYIVGGVRGLRFLDEWDGDYED